MMQTIVYQILIEGHLDPGEAEWFGGTVCRNDDGTSWVVLTLPDQAALHGVLNRIFALGLVLRAVNRLAKTR